MGLTIIAIAAFQFYWLNKAYEREERTLDMRTNFMFRETVFNLQAAKLKLDKLMGDSSSRIMLRHDPSGRPKSEYRKHRDGDNPRVINMMDLIMRKTQDSGHQMVIVQGDKKDTVQFSNRFGGRRNRLMQFLFDVDSLQDSVTVKELEAAYANRLKDQNMEVPFKVKRVPTVERDEPRFNEVTLGFSNPITYKLDLGNKTPYILKRIGAPILFTVFLLGFTILSFTLLYRNLRHQQRLADIKNEFISNITHELKTPIATVSVAIEAMRSFNANMDPARSKEYLDISANELQRLSLLVDKVLKLSMFEKKEVELKYEPLDMKQVVDEVTASMRLQFEKKGATVRVSSEGNTTLEGDRLHLVSVIFNLLDNALKYSNDKPLIHLLVKGRESNVTLVISDSGIGIPQEYHHRIFEKFFRVPTGNLHNAKGYGLGLSYVSHVINKHRGTIKVESVPGDGSKFYITLPRHNA